MKHDKRKWPKVYLLYFDELAQDIRRLGYRVFRSERGERLKP